MTPLELREAARTVLGKNSVKLEGALHALSKDAAGEVPTKYMEVYKENLLTVLTMLQTLPVEAVLHEMKTNQHNLSSVLFKPFVEAERRDIMNLTKPLEVEEGLYTCPKCKSKKTHSYSRQVRSADEPATTFITCANTDCSYKWKIG